MTCLSSHTVRGRPPSATPGCNPWGDTGPGQRGGLLGERPYTFFSGIFFLNHHVFVHTVLFIEQGLCVLGPVVTKYL